MFCITVMTLFLCLLIIACTAFCLYRKLNPQGVLLLAGLLMLVLALSVNKYSIPLSNSTGSLVFDLVKIVEETFLSNLVRAGFMIMAIGGYVAFMNQIKATNALVYIALKPLHIFRRYPNIAAIVTIPIGQLLFITTPSASGLGLLLVASIYPILVGLGVSRLSALSVIAAATLFDQGPGSANTALAAELIGKTNVEYFISDQLPLVLPTSLVVMGLIFFNNRFFDRKCREESYICNMDIERPSVPVYFAILPVLPLTILVLFSSFVNVFDVAITLNTTTAMLFSVLFALICVSFHTKNIKASFQLFNGFLKGMGNVFSNVVTLIVASEIFSKGLVALGFIDILIDYSSHIGLSATVVTAIFALIIFGAAMLMGSGNAAFFSFGPLLPAIAIKLSIPASALVLPLQLAASMGRAASPIAGVIVAIAGVAGISPIELAKRNTLPLIGGILFLLLYHLVVG